MPTFSGTQIGHQRRAPYILIFFVCSHVVVGSTKGTMMLFDLRGKGSVVQHYKGAVGSLRSIACHKTEPYFVSVGFDRHLHVHNLNNRAVLRKVKTCMYWVRPGMYVMCVVRERKKQLHKETFICNKILDVINMN
jgi:hypothetical protein